ncbi:iron-containing alcohol dehydrogenase [Verrucomicrobiota bacterium]
MENFAYCCPTRIVFGKGSISELASLVPADRKILLTYGGGSIKKNGVYDQVKAALGDRDVLEFGGIEPNPTYETLMKAVEVVKQEGIDFLLAVGGGSTLDGTKFIAAAAKYEGGDPWEILSANGEVKAAIPMGTVLTLPATGSEMNAVAVISRGSTQEKCAFVSEHIAPQFSVLDPETTYSLPESQVRNGVVDAFVHVTEQYLTYPADGALQDRQAEAILMTLIEEGPRTLKDPHDYDARANVVWCATQALNGLIGCGVPGDFATHMIGHELTAFFGLAHAESLAVVFPALLRHEKESKRDKLLQFARRVWNVTDGSDDEIIEGGIRKTEGFFQSLGMPTRLSDFDVSPDEAADRVKERFAARGTKLGERQAIGPDETAEILRASG